MQGYLEALFRNESRSLETIRVASVTEIESGWERSLFAFDLTLASEGGSTPLVARFYQGPSGPRRARWEAALLEALARAGVSVPQVEFSSEDESGHGTAVVIMERVPGRPLSETLAGSLPLTTDMAAALVALHRIPVESVFDGQLRPFDEPEFIAPDLDTVGSAVDRYGLDEFAPLVEQLQGSAPTASTCRILHNDYTPENILVSDDGHLTILDWSFAGVGDHRLDVAWSALWAEARSGSKARAAFLRAYDDVGGESIDHLEHFEALRLGARLMTIAAWLDGALEFPTIKVNKDVISGGYRPTVLAVYDRFRAVTGIALPRFEDL